MEIMLKNTRLLEKNMIKTRSTPASFPPVTVKWTIISKQKKKYYSQTRILTLAVLLYVKSTVNFFAKFVQNGKAHAQTTKQNHYFLPSDLSCNAEKQLALSSEL